MWRKWRTLNPDDRRLVFEALVRLLEARLRLWTMSFSRAVSSDPRADSTTLPDANAAGNEIRKIRWAIELISSRSPLSLTCLPQALAACRMLRTRGYAPMLVYGVRCGVRSSPVGGKSPAYTSHAWVECNGIPAIGDRGADQFTVLARFPNDPARSAP
jgi:Transglutaminase-like superfamily